MEVAQLVAYMARNHDVAGSTPAFKKLGLYMVWRTSPVVNYFASWRAEFRNEKKKDHSEEWSDFLRLPIS